MLNKILILINEIILYKIGKSLSINNYILHINLILMRKIKVNTTKR